MKQRIGLFYISNVFMLETELKELSKMFSFLEYVPFVTEFEYLSARFKHIGYSPYFDEIEEGLDSPEYIITIHKKGNEKNTYRVEKVKK